MASSRQHTCQRKVYRNDVLSYKDENRYGIGSQDPHGHAFAQPFVGCALRVKRWNRDWFSAASLLNGGQTVAIREFGNVVI